MEGIYLEYQHASFELAKKHGNYGDLESQSKHDGFVLVYSSEGYKAHAFTLCTMAHIVDLARSTAAFPNDWTIPVYYTRQLSTFEVTA